MPEIHGQDTEAMAEGEHLEEGNDLGKSLKLPNVI